MKSNIKLSEVMLKIGSFPIVFKDELMQDTIIKMNHFGLGIACLVDNKNKLVGVLTDGDLRRMILNVQKPMAAIFVDDYTASIERVVNSKEIHVREPFYFKYGPGGYEKAKSFIILA